MGEHEVTQGAAPFLMAVADVFPLRQGRLVMAAGRIERGGVRTGDEVEIVGAGAGGTAVVTGIDADGAGVPEARAGRTVGLLLPGATAVRRGHVLAAPGTIGAHAGFTAEIDLLSEDEGGADVRSGETLVLHVRTDVVPGTVHLLSGPGVLPPLHRATVRIALRHPAPLEPGHRFAFRHHGRAAGTGTVLRLGS
ncbi:EF-Tu C-terminal domain-related protein [Streptomyces griseosporeus]|uniref:EF-Tu C-terminal domain-related protein n=1 Tax=Streptomyces griseosporeus TaxID=1910 RepID=UPI0036FE7C2F